MNSLKTIQVLYKMGKIFSKIIFVFCIVGFCFCVAGILSLACGLETIKLGNVTLKGLIQTEAGLSMAGMYTSMIAAMILCAGEAVLSKFAEHYFTQELICKTPFETEGAKELMRLGILTICIPLGTQMVAEIFQAVMEQGFEGVAALKLDNSGSVALGVMFILMSLLCRYGAQIREESEIIKHEAVSRSETGERDSTGKTAIS